MKKTEFLYAKELGNCLTDLRETMGLVYNIMKDGNYEYMESVTAFFDSLLHYEAECLPQDISHTLYSFFKSTPSLDSQNMNMYDYISNSMSHRVTVFQNALNQVNNNYTAILNVPDFRKESIDEFYTLWKSEFTLWCKGLYESGYIDYDPTNHCDKIVPAFVFM